MRKEMIAYSIIGILAILGAVSSWELITSQQLGIGSLQEELPIDYAQLERAVATWEEKGSFSFSGAAPASPSASQDFLEQDNQEDALKVSVRNAGSQDDVIAQIAGQIALIEGLSVDDISEVRGSTETSISHKESVASDTVSAVADVISDYQTEVSTVVLSEDAEFDIIIILGQKQEE